MKDRVIVYIEHIKSGNQKLIDLCSYSYAKSKKIIQFYSEHKEYEIGFVQ